MPIDFNLLAQAQAKVAASQWTKAKLPLIETRTLPKSDGTGGATHWKAGPNAVKPPLVPIKPPMVPVPQKKSNELTARGTAHKQASSDVINQDLGENIGAPALLGAGIGGIYGALSAPKKQLLRSVLRGMTIGGAGGAGAGAAGLATANIATDPAFHPNPDFGGGYNAGITTGYGALGGGLLAGSLARRVLDEYAPIKETNTDTDKKKENPVPETKQSSENLSLAARAAALSAFIKQAGPVSEYASAFNPLNWFGGAHIGGLAALATPTRSLARQAELDSTDNFGRALANVFVPGVGTYRGFKRMGSAIRSPEMKAIRKQRQADKLRRETSMMASDEPKQPETAPKSDDAESKKEAGWGSELVGMTLNPLSLFGGNHIGGLTALATQTRSLDEQAKADEEVLANLFVPGRGAHNYFKRIGAATRSPEMLYLRNKAKQKKLQKLESELNPPKADNEVAKAAALAVRNTKFSLAEKAAKIGDVLNDISTGLGRAGAAVGDTLSDPAMLTAGLGAAAGAGLGAMTSKQKRLRNALIGAGLGGAAAGGAEYALPGLGLGLKYRGQDLINSLYTRNLLEQAQQGASRLGEVGEYALRRQSTLPGLELMYKQQSAQKAARVYEAAESVDSMPVKTTRESHKKCAPGEFNMNKEGGDTQLGGVNPEDIQKMLPAVGSAMGGMAGAGAGLGLGGALGGLYGAIAPGEYVERDEAGNRVAKRRGRLMGALRGLASGAGVGGLLGAGVGGVAGHGFGTHLADPSRFDAMMQKQQSARDLAGHDERFHFGCKVAFEIPEVVRNMFDPQHQAGQMTMGGAALGGLGGMALGALGAGKGKRMRGALGGALGGALSGGMAGAGAHHFAPEQSKQVLEYLKNLPLYTGVRNMGAVDAPRTFDAAGMV